MDTRRITALLRWRRAPDPSQPGDIFVLINHWPDKARALLPETRNFSIICHLNAVTTTATKVTLTTTAAAVRVNNQPDKSIVKRTNLNSYNKSVAAGILFRFIVLAFFLSFSCYLKASLDDL